ncbi:hypothetical protein GGR51DRAFT_569271 [Nemania sp. FL0031]|nr:hypothetical protein GGR51DRAFT_569271 [Nemania sp. FL0031]
MSPLFDPVHPHQAASGQFSPVLKAIAAKDTLQRLRRDVPPPYVLPTEIDVLSHDASVPKPTESGAMSEEIHAIIERPIDNAELEIISRIIAKDLIPREIYDHEVDRESERIHKYMSSFRSTAFSGRNGVRRRVVIAHHNTKRRWQKLGVWNPEWEFDQRKVLPNNDKFHKWTWRSHPNDVNRSYDEAAELAARGLRSRQHLRRGERAPIMPQSYPGQETTTTKVEEFLISRPWFAFQLEVAEEEARRLRLPIQDQRRYPKPKAQVIEWWKERGDWGDELSWKWSDESPSPEPEDLTPLHDIQDSPLEVAGEMEFTPSEIDELEMIDQSKSEQPKGSWATEEGTTPPYIKQDAEDVAWKKAHEDTIYVHGELDDLVFEAPTQEFLLGLFSCEDVPMIGHDIPHKLERGTMYPLQQNQHCLSQQQPQDRVRKAQSPEQQSRPQSSAEASSIELPVEPVLSPATPNKRLETIIVSTTAPITVRTRARKTRHTNRKSDPLHGPQEAGVQPKRGRGRPRKDGGQIICSTIEVKELKNGTEAGALRRRGRPRKTL